MDDTSPEIKKILQQKYAAMSPNERLMIGFSMFEAARTLVLASFPAQLAEEDKKRKLCERFYGKALAEQVYGSKDV